MSTKSIKVLTNGTKLEGKYVSNASADTKVFFYNGDGEWSLTYDEVSIIYARKEVSVTSSSNNSSCGLFSIGRFKNWYYSHSLFSAPDKLKDEIEKLLSFTLTGK